MGRHGWNPVSIVKLYHNPVKIDQGIPIPLGIFLRPPHPIPKPSDNPKINQIKNPITPWLCANEKARMKPLSHLEKPMPMIEREPNTHMHVPCIHKPSWKSCMQPITCKYSYWSCLIWILHICPLLSLSFFCLPLFAFSSWCFSLSETNSKAKLTKG